MIVLVVIGVLVWRKKKGYAVDKETGDRTVDLNYSSEGIIINNPTYQEEAEKKEKLKFKSNNSRFSSGAPDVDPLSQAPVEEAKEEGEEEGNYVDVFP